MLKMSLAQNPRDVNCQKLEEYWGKIIAICLLLAFPRCSLQVTVRQDAGLYTNY